MRKINQDFLELIQKSTLPGIWSQGINLARNLAVVEDRASEDELVYRVRIVGRSVTPQVTLWPPDNDWYCDCKDKNDVCVHVAAVVASIKNKTLEQQSQLNEEITVSGLKYELVRTNGRLTLERWIVHRDGKKEVLGTSLVSHVGGTHSGRISSSVMSVTQSDFAVDAALDGKYRGELERSNISEVFKKLSQCTHVFLDSVPVQVSSKPYEMGAILLDEGEGFRLKRMETEPATEFFENGAVLCKGNILKAMPSIVLSQSEKVMLSGNGKYFSGEQVKILVLEILPDLKKKLKVEISTSRLPEIKRVSPRIVLNLETSNDKTRLFVVPQIVSGPAGIRDPKIIYLGNEEEERALIRKLHQDLHLSPGQRVTFEGEDGVEFLERARNWEMNGSSVKDFAVTGELSPEFLFVENGFQIQFHSPNTVGDQRSINVEVVLKAWRENQNLVPLLGGGWASLPKNWLERYGDRIHELILHRNKNGELPSYANFEVMKICDELHHPYPDSLAKIRKRLEELDEHFETEPKDLQVSLRHYQRQGVSWLNLQKRLGTGVLLADDMGLGKTIQTICVFESKVLVVVPTSVLRSWVDQLKQFRPSLSVSVYHGANRKLDTSADVIITTYGLLRIDRAALCKEEWDTVVLDEAQTIKNADSQVAQAAHSIRAKFRIALSGTPIENRLEDLWSQFQFLNPGLLGDLASFKDTYVSSAGIGNHEIFQSLQKKIKPFLLRRMKKDVAAELPPRTEETLYCELSSEELEVYHSLLASTRKEILEKLEEGCSVFTVLEMLLRLRQACCHTGLIPGAGLQTSSKLELLVQTLLNSVELGHRALVFSQWTGLLDLIEPQLSARNLSYSRLDGSTRNRGEVVSQFQDAGGPKVMLISLKAGGVGLTLTAADHIFLMDPWWNPTVEEQAANRAHRIGQENPVFIFRLIAQNTIEERILELQKSKAALAHAILEDQASHEGYKGAITKEDLLALLN